jgi:hypothetical protein
VGLDGELRERFLTVGRTGHDENSVVKKAVRIG